MLNCLAICGDSGSQIHFPTLHEALLSISAGDSLCPKERVPRWKLVLPNSAPKGFSGRLKGWLTAALPVLSFIIKQPGINI